MNIKRGGSALLLAEIMLAIMFFALSLTVSLRLLVSAREYMNRSEDISHAVVESQSIAESFKASGGNIKKTADMLGVHTSELRFVIYYNEEWEPVPFDSAYSAELIVSSNLNGATMALITVYKGRETLLTIDVAAVKLQA
jgi:hypothetical protein